MGSQSHLKIPFIAAITGDDNKKQQALAKKAGMNIMLPKPINSKDLYQLLKNHGIINK
jgi:CheY-like chemotaxis protein